jgi:coenzyme F420-reducing hydrogenase beta subunit
MRRILTIEDQCTACSACYSICTDKAIKLIENDEGFYYPNIETSFCTDCGKCDAICPELNKKNKVDLIQSVFYGWHRNENIRANSSSGGVFSALADYVIRNNGVVFGAIYNLKNKKVCHISTDEIDLSAIRKSKYVESYIGDSFLIVQNHLKKGTKVLFTGTPCQVAGLQAFLKHDYPNLILCDFICHGVPPMKLLNDHLKLLERKYKSEIVEINFRPKTFGWSIQSLKCVFSNSSEYKKTSQFDGYFSAFLRNFALRKSCYKCRYSKNQHQSDITIADFWGYRKLDPKINDEKGISLIFANTTKGESVINEVQNIFLKTIDWKFAEYVFCHRNNIAFNIEKREYFFKYYLTFGWEKTISKLQLKGSFKARVKYFILNRLLGKNRKK